MCCSRINNTIPGQGSALHAWFSVLFPTQSVPLYWAGIFDLFLSWVPPPQVKEQVSQLPHAFQPQSTMLIKITHQPRLAVAWIDIIQYQGMVWHCRLGFQYHFLYSLHHRIGQEYLFCSSLGYHLHKWQSKFPMCSIHSRCNWLG